MQSHNATGPTWLPLAGHFAVGVDIYLGGDDDKYLFGRIASSDESLGIQIYRYTAEDYMWFPWDYWNDDNTALYFVRADDPCLP